MFTQFFSKSAAPPAPKEGDLYKVLTVSGHTFQVRYGYYEDFERQYNDPMAIYPDFIKEPRYTDGGEPLVTAMQDTCRHFQGGPDGDTCGECQYYRRGEDLIGICTCPQKIRVP